MLQSALTQSKMQSTTEKASLEMSPSRKVQLELSHFNQHRLTPNFIDDNWAINTLQNAHMLVKEGNFVENERQHIQQYLVHMPHDP